MNVLSRIVDSLKNSRLSWIQIIGLSFWPLSVLLVCASVVLLAPGEHTVVDSYLLGGERWVSRLPLYTGPGGFIYSPFFAFLFSPLTYIPYYVVDICWRLLSISFYFMSCVCLLRYLSSNSKKNLLQWIGMFSIIAVPIAFSGFRNGQMNVVLVASMVMICHLLLQQRWCASALLLALMICLKPTFIVFFLLASSLFRQLWKWIFIYVIVFLFIPVFFVGFDYCYQQYCNYIDMMRSAVDLGVSTPKWASFFNIPMQLFHVGVDHALQVGIKLFLALATWVGCCYAFKKLDRLSAVIYLFSFAGTYHLLFNPRSVNTDYIILGTITAIWFTAALYIWKDKCLAITVGLISAGILFAYDISRLLVPDSTSWFNPLMACVFAVVLVFNLKNKRSFQALGR